MNRAAGRLLLGLEILVLTALIVTTRCANYQDVFAGGDIYFTDADCYARMTRVRLCAQHPGLVLRHHSFENFPEGTTPHTTAPLDYAIVLLSVVLWPFTSRAIELAGAFISPLFAVLAGGFLCWWSRGMRLRFRWAMLILFAISPILVHGTALGRPDHQSLLILLVLVAICADWMLESAPSRGWSVVSGLAWGFAIWVSAYEPLLLLALSGAIILFFRFVSRRKGLEAGQVVEDSTGLTKAADRSSRRWKWIACAVVVLLALVIERRLPSFSVFVNDPIFRNWSRTIGELMPVPFYDYIWIRWLGWLVLAIPIVLFVGLRSGRDRDLPLTIGLLLVATFGLTMWQARWGYFFAVLFVLAVPGLLGLIRWRAVSWVVFIFSLWPVLRDWDQKIWPNEVAAANLLEQRQEMIGLRELSLNLISNQRHPFLAPWWLSPAITYWSGQPGVAGSSHQSLSGIADTARFFLAEDAATAQEILERRQVAWVIVYDAQRVETNSSAIIGKAISGRCLGEILDRHPTEAPPFLILSTQTGFEKLFQVMNKW